MALDEYRRRRDFSRTPEPTGDPAPPSRRRRPARHGADPGYPGWDRLPAGRRFCVQMHRATRLHFDVRLEHAGVLLSWAVPRGPSLDPAQRRYAVHVEDHPLDYGEFEGVIPDGYGAGTVMLWDAGTVTWVKETADHGVEESMRRGDLKFSLEGVKLQGEFALVRMSGRSARRAAEPEGRDWLMLKKRDAHAVPAFEAVRLDRSISTGRSLAQIAAEAGGDPKGRRVVFDEGPGASSPDGGVAASGGAGQAVPAAAAGAVVDAPRAPFPAGLRPMLAATATAAFSREGWVFELKHDGVRCVVEVRDGTVRARGRSDRDETARYPELAEVAACLDVGEAVLDGEVVGLDAEGRPSFERLQRRINVQGSRVDQALRAEVPVVFNAFDILWAAGHDLCGLPLLERKRILRALLRDGDHVRYSDHVETDGEAFFAAVREQGLEGMVAKRADSRYEPGRRSDAWLKVKSWLEQDCVIAGVTEGRGGRGPVGALVLGVLDGGHLVHAGRAGSGLDAATIDVIRRRLEPLRTDACPFDTVPDTGGPVSWVTPQQVCTVRFSGWTQSGTMRHPTFRTLRDDLRPEDCVRETPATPRDAAEEARATGAARSSRRRRAAARSGDIPASVAPPSTASPSPDRAAAPATAAPSAEPVAVPPVDRDLAQALQELAQLPANATWQVAGRRLKLTNLDKVLFPDSGITKRSLVDYLVRMSAVLLPHLRDRAVGMQVFPDGIDGKHFWRKRLPDHAPPWIRRWTYHGDESEVTYIVVEEPATLGWIANSGSIDIHPWHSRVDAPDRPDWAVFDLDPFPPLTFEDVVLVARLVKAALDHYGLRGLPKTSGQTGLQIYVPIDRGPTQSQVRDWVEEVARAIGRVVPDRITWDWSVARRTGKLRIDYTQNVVGKTLAAPYSPRPAPGAPVSTPVTWEELDDPALRPDGWTIHSVGERLQRLGDIFAPVIGGGQSLPL